MGNLFVAFMCLLMIAAWVTHVIVCIIESAWILLAIGAIVFPVGIVHGVANWFGLV